MVFPLALFVGPMTSWVSFKPKPPSEASGCRCGARRLGLKRVRPDCHCERSDAISINVRTSTEIASSLRFSQ
jgi:hypothetical protein